MDGGSSSDVSSTAATDQPTDGGFYVIAVTRNRIPVPPSRMRVVQSGRNGTVPTVIFLDSALGGDGDDGARAGDDDDDAHGFSAAAVPASGVAIACLPETTAGECDGECAVCLEEYAAGDAVRTMPCAHGFHERCIFGWLRLSRLCPLCRFALPPEEE